MDTTTQKSISNAKRKQISQSPCAKAKIIFVESNEMNRMDIFRMWDIGLAWLQFTLYCTHFKLDSASRPGVL